MEDLNISMKVSFTSYELVDRLNTTALELNSSWDELINLGVERLLNDIHVIRELWVDAHLKNGKREKINNPDEVGE